MSQSLFIVSLAAGVWCLLALGGVRPSAAYPASPSHRHATPQPTLPSDGSTRVSGVLGFEAGRGYFLAVEPSGNPYGAARIWLKMSEDKILVRQLEGLKGQRVGAEGRLRRLPDDVLGAAIPAHAVVLEDFRITSRR